MRHRQKRDDTLSESYLLETAFASDGPIFVMHDDGMFLCDTIEVRKYDLVCKHTNQRTPLKKIACLLAAPVSKLVSLKQHVKVSSTLRALNLRGKEKMADRHKTACADDCVVKQSYQFVLRNGKWFTGLLIGQKRYHIVVRVGGASGKIVLVYKHAIYDIQATKSHL